MRSRINHIQEDQLIREQFLDTLKHINIDFSGFPIGKIILVVLILTITQVFRRFFIKKLGFKPRFFRTAFSIFK